VSCILFCGFDGFDVMGKDEKESTEGWNGLDKEREGEIMYWKRFRANSGRWRVITYECENLSSCALVIEPVPHDVSYRRWRRRCELASLTPLHLCADSRVMVHPEAANASLKGWFYRKKIYSILHSRPIIFLLYRICIIVVCNAAESCKTGRRCNFYRHSLNKILLYVRYVCSTILTVYTTVSFIHEHVCLTRKWMMYASI